MSSSSNIILMPGFAPTQKKKNIFMYHAINRVIPAFDPKLESPGLYGI